MSILFYLLVKSVKKREAVLSSQQCLTVAYKVSCSVFTFDFLPGLKRREREAEGLYLRNVDVRNVWAVTVLSHAA
jgi:hypothetical protein